MIKAPSPAFFLALLLAIASPASGKTLHGDYLLQRGHLQRYDDWLVGCDNRGNCTMLGFPQPVRPDECDYAVVDMAIRISLEGPVGSDPVVALEPYGKTSGPTRPGRAIRPFMLDVELDRADMAQPHSFSRHVLAPLEAAGVLTHLAQGKPLLGRSPDDGKVRVRFPGAGFARALRAMQTRRKVLVAQAQAAQPLHRIGAVPQIISGVVPILAANPCHRLAARQLQRFRFASGAELWIHECADRATTRSAYLSMADKDGKRQLPLWLPDPRDGPIDAGGKGLLVGDFVFDFDFGILRHYLLKQARSDCGMFRAWGYTEQGWVLIERREMPVCQGLEPEHWIRTYDTPTLGTGPDA